MEFQFIDQDQNVVHYPDPAVGMVSTGNGCPHPRPQPVQSLLRPDPILADQHHGMVGTGGYPPLTQEMYTGLHGHTAGLQGYVPGTHGNAAGPHGHAAGWSPLSQPSAVNTNAIGDGDRGTLAEYFAPESGNRTFDNGFSLVPETNGGAGSVDYPHSSSQSANPNALERHTW